MTAQEKLEEWKRLCKIAKEAEKKIEEVLCETT